MKIKRLNFIWFCCITKLVSSDLFSSVAKDRKEEISMEISVDGISKILETFFAKESSILNIIFCGNSNEALQKVVRKLDKSISVEMETCNNITERKEERKFVLLLIESTKLDDILKQMTTNRFDFSGYYLLHFINHPLNIDYSGVFKSFFDLFVYNLNIVENNQLITFMPFTAKSCHSTEPMKINEIKNGNWTNENFFPSKMRNFYKCSLKIVSFLYAPSVMEEKFENNSYKLYGSDIELINGFAQALNFTIDYDFDPTPGAWGILTETGEATGGFAKLINRSADAMVGMLSKTIWRTKYVSFTSTILFNPVILLVPPGAPLNAFEKLFQPYEFEVWICLFVAFITGLVIVTLLTVKSDNKLKLFVIGREIKMPVLNMIVAFVGGSQHVLPIKSAARILLMSFLLFCLIKRTLYTASLFQFLQSDIRKSIVSSIDELMERKFNVFYYPSFDTQLKILKFYKM
jgi:hypothetical protein